MKRFTLHVGAWLVLAMGASTAQAIVIFEDTFDTYASQAALEASWTPIGCTASGVACSQVVGGSPPALSNTLSTDTAVSGTQSLLNHSLVGAPNTSDASQRNQRIIPVTPTLAINDQLIFSIDFYDLTPTTNPQRQFANIQTSTGPGTSVVGQLISLGVNNNQLSGASGGNFYMARLLGYTVPTGVGTDPDGGPDETAGGAGAYFKLNDFTTTARSLGWHNLKVNIKTTDLTSTDYNFYVDGVLSEHVHATNGPQTYTVLRIGAGVSSATQDAYYDNFKIEYIAAAAGQAGDYNGNGKVDAADYVKWRMGASPDSTQAGYDLWRLHFGEGTLLGSGGGLSGGAAVPEPMSLGLVLAGLAFLGMGRRKPNA